ncbi:hypothetical protein ACFZC6_26125 [Streptomyces ossamyceticus]|uniref:Cation-transporting P-type ATPase N-terminal domain-containing protein n=1 Tax=Streptomyces ossamyceticus TaxID=249581 RepID=A0ABV2V0K9_9ACTN
MAPRPYGHGSAPDGVSPHAHAERARHAEHLLGTDTAPAAPTPADAAGTRETAGLTAAGLRTRQIAERLSLFGAVGVTCARGEWRGRG